MKKALVLFAAVFAVSSSAFATRYTCTCDVPGAEDGSSGIYNVDASSREAAAKMAKRTRCGDQFSRREMNQRGTRITCEEMGAPQGETRETRPAQSGQ